MENINQSSDVLILLEKRRKAIFNMVDELKEFAMTGYGDFLQESALDFLEPFHFEPEKELKVFGLYIWWSIFSEPLIRNKYTIFHLFHKNKVNKLRKRHFLRNVLASWDSIRPGFYEVNEVYEPRIFTIHDIFDESKKFITVYNQIYQPVKADDVVSGIVFPLGDGTYTCLFDFLHLPPETTQMVLEDFRQGCYDQEELLHFYPLILRKVMREMLVQV